MLIRTIARLRRLSKSSRNSIALGAATSFTGVIVLLWFTSFSPAVEVGSPAAVAESGVFSVFMDGLRERTSDLTQISEIWAEFSAESEVESVSQESLEVLPAEFPRSVPAGFVDAEPLVAEVVESSTDDVTTTESASFESSPSPTESTRSVVPIRIATTSRAVPQNE